MKKKLVALILITCVLAGGLVYAGRVYHGTSVSVEELQAQIEDTQAKLGEENATTEGLNAEIEALGGEPEEKLETKERWEYLRDTVKDAVENPVIEAEEEEAE